MTVLKQGLLLVAAMIASTLTANAALYKWIDEKGVTQFTQTPPASGRYEEVRPSSQETKSSNDTESATHENARQGEDQEEQTGDCKGKETCR